jgi:hypothetical protein
VTENTTPNGVAPEGFEFLETSSYTVALAVSKGEGLTLSKIDYIFDTAAAGLAGKDITTSKVGRLCAETGSFVISEALGEVEFEVEENEVTLNLNKAVTAEAEWGKSIPERRLVAIRRLTVRRYLHPRCCRCRWRGRCWWRSRCCRRRCERRGCREGGCRTRGPCR